jgi:N-methylhydantoinase A
MVRALRVISVERGLDPRRFALVAFGGAGGLHACAIAGELGCRTILVPRAAGVLSALGLATSTIRRDYVTPFVGATRDVLEPAFRELEVRAHAELDSPFTERMADLRYAGQSFELTVPGSSVDELFRAFHAQHELRYGHRIDDEPVELISLRLVASTSGATLRLVEPEPAADTTAGRRAVLLEEGEVDAVVLVRATMGRGSKVEGPAVVEFPEATCLVRPGWAGAVDNVGTLVLERRA